MAQKNNPTPKQTSGKEKAKMEMVRQFLEHATHSINNAKQLLAEITGGSLLPSYQIRASALKLSGDGKIVEGVFDGQHMIDKEGKKYPVPANYASKSKLVAGDVLKLTIGPDGSFIFKQIGPIERKKLIGTLTYEDGTYKVIAGGRSYNVLLASVTYFKVKPGDQLTILVPEKEDSNWAAIESAVIEPEGS